MPPYGIEFKPSADNALKRLPGPVQRRIAVAIDALADNPRPRGAVKLTGADDLYRVRAGDYRVIYKVVDDQRLILVARIAHRKDAYRGI